MTGTADLSYEQLFTINRSAQETGFLARLLIHPAADKAVRVTFNPGLSGAFSFGVLRDGKRVPVDAL
jgi:hypothetical protein